MRLTSMMVAALLAAQWMGFAQEPVSLTLQQAKELALKQHPRIASANLNAQATGEAVTQARAAYQPQLGGNVTAVGAERGTSIAAGTLQTSGLSNRVALGLSYSQLLTDFGRTSNLAESARLRASAQEKHIGTARAQVLLQVEHAYYAALSADAVLKVAQARVEMHRLTLRQITALSASELKSSLDVSFAEVALSESELALYQAENFAREWRAQLAAAMGNQKNDPMILVDVPLGDRLADDVETLVAEALLNRPELSAAKLNYSAAERLADAENKLRYPSLTALGTVGAVPVHQNNFVDRYAAAGVNISLPFLNGGLYSSRRAEAELRTRIAGKETETLVLQISGGVRTAWLESDTAWRRLDVTARLVTQTATALRLAKTRYEIGLSGILELTQSQLAVVSAQIAAANAKYEYLTRVANVKYAIGAIR